MLLSKQILDELLSVLSKKFSRDKEEISRVAILLSEMSEMIFPSNCIHLFKDDPDNRILECALDGKVDLIVTGDKKILDLRGYKGVRIVSLRTYLETC